jgi:hypothetical protein
VLAKLPPKAENREHILCRHGQVRSGNQRLASSNMYVICLALPSPAPALHRSYRAERTGIIVADHDVWLLCNLNRFVCIVYKEN